MKDWREGYLFEVSWEVCNRIGGIHTVITTKVREALNLFSDRYILLGPDLKTNLDFEETNEKAWQRLREATAVKDLSCRFGRWKIPGEPRVILVSAGKKYDKDQLLYRLWEAFGVDSIAGGWDYVEPVMFSFACGEVIETVYNLCLRPYGVPAVAHFHEWMTGAGLLYLKKRIPEIGTVFTTHATILGRALAGSGMDIYAVMDRIAPQQEARLHNISAKYSMESTATREADCFTTVSDITATEAKNFLGRCPDVITPNGLDLERLPDWSEDRAAPKAARCTLMAAASRFLRRELTEDTRILVISGRYEFHNKGMDLFLNALGRLEKEGGLEKTLVVYLFVLNGHMDLIPALKNEGAWTDTCPAPVATHRLQNEAADPILQACRHLGLRNAPENRINVIYIPAYLNGHDGFINLPYLEALSGCDLGVFPSYYEPWGYTPLESAAHAVPTVTTDQAGFGLWVQRRFGEDTGVQLLKRRGRPIKEIENHLVEILRDFVSWSDEKMTEKRKSARRVAVQAHWKDFYKFYVQAYEKAAAKAAGRASVLPGEDKTTGRHVFAGTVSTQPHFRTFTAVAKLPEEIGRLRELAYNLWWAWHPRALDLFATLDLKLWSEMGNNPVRMLETVSPDIIAEAAKNEGYLNLYHQILQQFDAYMGDRGPRRRVPMAQEIHWSSPIAYFSAEYGIHESLPLYSGGLGTLSGDHLKTASDLGIPMVAVGLLYKNGYFQQVIDETGRQTELYPDSDFSSLPVQIVTDDRGQEVRISIDLPGRTLFAHIWQIKVGRVNLYLLDTDVPLNTPQDCAITSRLYAAEAKTRIEQEILLGIGGYRLLRKLGIKPCIYHINEGHSAFLLLERIESLIEEEGLSFEEACEVVRNTSVFTTHTPVEAGNEKFPRDLMEHYFGGLVKRLGMSWAQFWELGRRDGGGDFYMNVLAFKLTFRSNAVSLVHGQLARRMWREVWKGFDESDIPIGHITNGVHIFSFIAPRMRSLLDVYLGMDWDRHLTDGERWSRVQDIPDALLWRIRYELKQKAMDMIRDDITKNPAKYGAPHLRREEIFARLNPAALTIGFSRRFAPYKRALLVLSNLDRLDRIINHPSRPVQIVFSGKAHPNDAMGKELIEKVIAVCRDERFRGRIFFLENYDMRIARHLVQGMDVWLNNPRRHLEASGTSGQKVVINGVLNLSVSDGWWVEAYDGTNGWTIGPVRRGYEEDRGDPDGEDADSLYHLLEDVVVPLFYDRDASGLPTKWLAMIKRSMQSLVPVFNTDRMIIQYLREMYEPAAKRGFDVCKDSFRLARAIADWKTKIPMRFSSLRLMEVSVEGIRGDTVIVDEPLRVSARIDPGKVNEEELLVELVIGPWGSQGFVDSPHYVPLRRVDRDDQGVLTYAVDYYPENNGSYRYGLRVIPVYPDLASKLETGLVLWG